MSDGLRSGRTFSGRAVTVIAVVACGVIAAWLTLLRPPATGPRHAPPPASSVVSTRSSAPPAAVRLLATFPVQSNLMAAQGGRLYAVEIGRRTATVVRVDPDGTITRRSARDPLAPYVSAIAAQGGSLYVGTNVVARFTSARNELVRMSASSLARVARTRLPAGIVALASSAHGIWLALTDDRLVRLDPASLAVRASYTVPGAIPAPLGSSSFDSLTLGPGGLWATFGTARRTTLERFDPATLSLLGAIHVPEAEQGIRVVADSDSIWLVGRDFVRRVLPSGALLRSVPIPGVQGAAVSGTRLLVLRSSGAAAETLDVLDERGRVVARSDVDGAGGSIAVGGRVVWLGRGLRIARWRLVVPGR